MRFPIPDFVPVPGPETMHLISLVSPAVGIGLVDAAALLLLVGRGRKKRRRTPYILMDTGALLILNHGV